MVDIEVNLRDLEQRIAEAAGRAGRDPAEITLLAVTKMFTVDRIQAAYELGVRHFGENRVGEAAEKAPIVNQWIEEHTLPPITWHMVGHLQSRKAKDAIQLFDIIHSVDTLKLAKRLDRLLPSSPPGLGGKRGGAQARRRPFCWRPTSRARRVNTGLHWTGGQRMKSSESAFPPLRRRYWLCPRWRCRA